LLVATGAAVALVLAGPWVGAFRGWLRGLLAGRFGLVVNASMAVLATAAVGAVLLAIRDRRAWRYAALAAAIALAALSAAVGASASAEANAVERFHFLEYGVVAWLFYRAVRPARPPADLSLFVLPVLAGVLVGVADEGLQWFVPDRTGEVRDIAINLAAVCAGLVASLAISPPERFQIRLTPEGRRRIGWTAAAAVLALAVFMRVVHLGVVIHDPEAGTFVSRYSAEDLRRFARDRAERWAVEPPPLTLPTFAREDQYLAEGLWHVRARNAAWATDVGRAWGENRILERYFAPVLDTPTYFTPSGAGWPALQRADAERRAAALGSHAFVSRAEPTPGYLRMWPKPVFWSVAAVLTAALAIFGGVSQPADS